MKRVLTLALLLVLLMAGAASAEVYLSRYEAVFEAAQNSARQYANVQVVLRITYAADQPLTGGFKFVGPGKISNVMVADGDGGPVGLTVEQLKETKISYDFPRVTSGSKTIVITFIMEDAIEDRLLYSSFDSQWVGKWQIPVNNAVYTFIFPPGFVDNQIDTNFTSFNRTTADGRQAIQIVQPLLAETAFSLRVKPSFGGHSFGFFAVMLGAALFLVLYIVINIRRLPDCSRLDTRELTPAEVGFLKKGIKHSICVAVFDLLQLGRLIKTPPNELQSLKADDTLYAYETLLMGFFSGRRTLKHLFRDDEPKQGYKKEMLNALTWKGLLKDASAARAAAGRVQSASVLAAIIMAAAWKFSRVDSLYLVVSLVAPVVGAAVSVVLYMRRPKSGRARYALEKWEKTVEDHSFVVRAGNPIISYGVAILGLQILAGTVFEGDLGYASYARVLQGGSSSGCSGCGSSDSSGSGGGDGGGGSGGCGGCGGGGGD
ncbi:MAG: DUF2207 domain-containing protein [Nitrospirae bacterium]|nr:DUF2207 domain-containing protein [Nitrospirota bacterium]